MTARLRPELAELPGYVEGKTVAGAIKLASNETVHGPLPSVRTAIEQAIGNVNRYPDNHNIELRSRLAQHLDSAGCGGFAPEQIAVGCGSVSLCQRLIQSTASVGDEVLFGWRSFEMYPLQVRVTGAIPIQVPLRDETFDLYAMLAAVTDRTRLIFVCNPNNPTATVVDPQALARFVEAVPSHILIAIDEAYVEYIRDGMQPDSLGLVRSYRNVVALRTFSKAYGLAGLRVGYAIGDPEVINALNKVVVPFTTTSISQAAAIASLEAADELLARTDAVVAERARVTATLRGTGFTLPPSQTNFIWLPLGMHTPDFVRQAADARIVLRPYGTDGVRITIGAPEENNALLRFAQDWRTATMQTDDRPAVGAHAQPGQPAQ
jgi:histidinol-phosphate aminotransferase